MAAGNMCARRKLILDIAGLTDPCMYSVFLPYLICSSNVPVAFHADLAFRKPFCAVCVDKQRQKFGLGNTFV